MKLIEVTKGKRFPQKWLEKALTEVKTALFFAKTYELSPQETAQLLLLLFPDMPGLQALAGEAGLHSSELQDYLIEAGYDELVVEGRISVEEKVPDAPILPALWELAEVEIAKSIKDVITKLGDAVALMPGKEANLMFESMAQLNKRRPTVGDFGARLQFKGGKPNAVVVDASGSVSRRTLSAYVEEVVGLAYKANAHLIVVSDTATIWGPGEFSVASVMEAAEFGGTRYETLIPLFRGRDWGVVLTVADYDSYWAVEHMFADLNGHVDLVLDISIEDRPTYLSQCIGRIADEVRPLMIAEPYTRLS